ncbi:amylo-alpha-1,6-glucosidase [Alkalilimnicola sp. S0819]|uniref:amylo-alpha-1,6-glucosidase n=1 Tax=Alkalilimnicola sp. S0819 TaxID=2613922 RepID=UPI00126191E2|nr:amylo-alpha-1,6-glucosidase [Alkalilimnicola sp. S0819]KAB7624004.1 amylo-alpha-1,6-glucosidase [Alkalilimnicola sp. S0819]MPQ16612.1 Bacterial alpha-L-rhamnosidase [Alkalilimnicola sp. S0819]
MAEDLIRVDEQWYVLATSSRADDRTHVLKAGESFSLCDRHGDMAPLGNGEAGLFHRGTRYLSRWELQLSGRNPLLLNASVSEGNELLHADLTTPDIHQDHTLVLPKGTLHLFRARVLRDGAQYEHLRLSNYGLRPESTWLELSMDADYADIFEVRGHSRRQRGHLQEEQLEADTLTLGYQGLDGVHRCTRIHFSETPARLNEHTARFDVQLAPGAHWELFISVLCEQDGVCPTPLSYPAALRKTQREHRQSRCEQARISSSHEQFNDWLERSVADLTMLTSPTPQGPYPYAGVPWFSTPFGRDGLITALQCLTVRPQLARGVLAYLAAHQADTLDPTKDAAPGKILHETRQGEMARLGEVPFAGYYGSVDATPLFVQLAGAYYRRSGDRALIERIWPNIERALAWIDDYGDADGDGFVEYARHSTNGLVQQGWKDSEDSVFHADGRDAEPPIALCEVQGYVYAAKHAAADLAALLGHEARAAALHAQAESLKKRFNEAFWVEEIGCYALALDGDKRPCAVVSSNAGHALHSGIAEPDKARRVADTLLARETFSGWGIRTVAKGSARYNPMSYHNGSVWPHDTAMIAAGLARYGFKEEVLRLMTGLFDTALAVDLKRLPELFCGFTRLPGQGPTLYPVACLPQAWASGAVFQLLQACLGLEFDAPRQRLCFNNPQLPDYIPSLQIRQLQLGEACVDLALRRHPRHVSVNVQNKRGPLEIIVRV